MAWVRVGTSGYDYPHWRTCLYRDAPRAHWLARYSEVFDALELNVTFYRLPSERAVKHWHGQTPGNFLFSIKGSRFITHQKRLEGCREALKTFLRRLRPLGDKLGVLLWQFPRSFSSEYFPRLEPFLELLPSSVRQAFEFREASWYTPKVYALLEAHGAALCEHDALPLSSGRPTGDFRYLRFHGRGLDACYGRRRLRPFAESLRRGHTDAYAFFNNDTRGCAVFDALTLRRLLEMR